MTYLIQLLKMVRNISTLMADSKQTHTLSLYWTSSGFKIDGVECMQIPLFIRKVNMRIELYPTMYMLYISLIRGRTRSHKTWKSYANSLLPYLRYMELHEFDWKSPGERHLAHYRTSLQSKGLTQSSILKNMRVICDFYEWCSANKFVENLPFNREIATVRNFGMLQHIEKRKLFLKADLLPRVPSKRRFPHYFNHAEQNAIFSRLSARDQLMMEWALYTGAREFEICNLRVHDLPTPETYSSRRAYNLPIVGKGHVAADLCVPTWLMNKTYQYVHLLDRAVTSRAAKKRGRLTSDHIFLSRWGYALKPDSLYRSFRTALNAANVKGKFHDLRHTFAISTLDKLMQLPQHRDGDGLNALLDLKYLMRHSSISTTQIYLEARNFYLTEIYSDLYALPEHYTHD